MKPVIVRSSCLGSEACRYNGQALNESIVAALAPFVTFRTVCPEVSIGLGTPREPVRLQAEEEETRLIQPATGKDVTRKMRDFSESFLKNLSDIDGFLLKSRSPSCGVRDVKIYTGTIPTSRHAGLFGGAVLERFPHLAVEDEARLRNFNLREHYLTRIFTNARWRELRRRPSMASLVRFHATHKLLLQSHSEEKMRELGRIVANHDKAPVINVFGRYGEVLAQALARPAHMGSRINVLEHAFGFVSGNLTAAEKRHFLSFLEKVRARRSTVHALSAMMRSWIVRFEVKYLADQVFFDPFPEDLVSLDDSGKGREI